MSGPQLGRPPEEGGEIRNLLQILNNENKNDDDELHEEIENFPTDHIPTNYVQNENSEPHFLGLRELYADYAPLELCSPHSEDSILESKGDLKIEPIESFEVDILAYFFSLSDPISFNRWQNTVSSKSTCTSRELATSKSASFVKVIDQQGDNPQSIFLRCALFLSLLPSFDACP